jgi:hypothetical protein
MNPIIPEDTKNEIVSLAGRSFAIPMTPADSERRKQYFASLESRVKSAVQQNLQGPQVVQVQQNQQGPQGFQGQQNLQGFQGTQGQQKGPQGFQGQNQQGPQGFQGTQGFQGQNQQGPQGFQGQNHQGPQGFQGGWKQQGGGGLLESEKEVLRAIGIDESLTLQLAPYLPNFFDTLPKCSSDPNMMLSKDCEDAYFVLWSTMYAAQHEAQKLFQENQVAHKYMSDLDAATSGQIVKDIQRAHKEVLRFDPEHIQELFTRGITPLYSEEEKQMILSLFTR